MHKKEVLKKFLHFINQEKNLRDQEAARYDWAINARSSQLLPKGNWRVWLILAGRGFGKTRTGAETLRQWIREGLCRRLALVAATETEARSVMVEGKSGLLAVHPSAERPLYEPSKRQLFWKN